MNEKIVLEVIEAMDTMVNGHCGRDSESFCEQYGCRTLQEYSDMLKSALSDGPEEAE